MKSAVITVIVLLFALGSYSQPKKDGVSFNNSEWIYASTSVENESYFFRNKYIEKKDNKITIWLRVNLKMSLEVNKKMYFDAYKLLLVVFNCNNNQIKTLQLIYYSHEGETLQSTNYTDDEFTYVVPNSVMENVLSQICNKYNK